MSLLSRIAVQAARAYGFLSSRSTNVSADYLVVAGGGGGGNSPNFTSTASSGGGAGGLLASTATLSTINTYSIVVGAGGNGAGSAVQASGNNGSSSSISGTGLSTITATGGGGGAYPSVVGSNGGSGGGGGEALSGGTGVSGQGYAGGTGADYAGAGGGGAGAIGGSSSNGSSSNGGAGGAGASSSISGSSVTYAGGGGGGTYNGTAGAGGSGGGGAGGKFNVSSGTSGTANLGGGGGGGTANDTGYSGGNGGSGIVIISYTATAPKFVGGTITTSGGKQIHTFTSSGTLSPVTEVTASYLVVAGGGGGGSGYAGGGGAGGYQTSSLTLYSPATYIVTVGAGGAGGTGSNSGVQGSNSVLSGTGISTVTSIGGGYGAAPLYLAAGGNGGSGGGSTSSGTKGLGTAGQGNDGGVGSSSSPYVGGGGGGGAGATGSNGSGSGGGNGGNGSTSSISGSSTYYAGGGGGGTYTAGTAGTGGLGGGGAGANTAVVATSGTANTGGGGGGGFQTNPGANIGGGAGGSGVVIISYAGSQVFNGGTITTSGGNTIHTFYATGALTPITNNLTNSLRFRSSASAYLNRTPTVTSNQQKWTWSCWVKRSNIGGWGAMFSSGILTGTSSFEYITFRSDDSLQWVTYTTSTQANLITTQVFRDPSAWYHIVVAVDTTQATSTNRVKMYVNGNQITSFSTATYPSLNYSSFINSNQIHTIGRDNGGDYLDGYMSDVYFIDGQALEPYYFGSNDSNNVWKPISYYGTYGTNGFYLPFKTYSTIGGQFSSYYGNFNSTGNTSTSTYLRINDNAAFNSGSSDFCWELFFYATTSGLLIGKGGSVIYEQISLTYDGSNGITCYISNPSNVYIVGGTYTFSTLASNQWNHVAVYRNGSSWYMAVNGSVQNVATSSNSVIDNSGPFIIGGYSNATTQQGYPITGRMSNLRYVVGSSVYGASNFTPPTSALTAISGTQLLTLQNSSIVDNSANSLTITQVNGSYPVTTTLSSSIGYLGYNANDESGNGNNWLTNNMNVSTSSATTYDAMTDVPTNTSSSSANYPTLNPLIRPYSANTDLITWGNLRASSLSGPGASQASTFVFSTGKWYCEVTATLVTSPYKTWIGVCDNQTYYSLGTWASAFVRDYGYTYISSGNKCVNSDNAGNGTAYGASYTTGDIIGIAIDADAGSITFYKNGTSQGTAFTGMSNVGGYSFGCTLDNGSGTVTNTCDFNFGQRPFTYTPPSGYVALNTYNLSTPTIIQGNRYMDATIFTGNGGTQTITNAGSFKPDFVWTKNRSGSYNHYLYDSVRGVNTPLISNNTNAETTLANSLISFNSNGMTLGLNDNANAIASYLGVGWQWQAGQGTTSSNTNGSVTSTVSVNATAGFSVATFTTPSASHSNFTFGHGLGVAPKMVITKSRSAATDWNVYHVSMGATKGIYLNQTLSAQTSTGFWQDTTPSSTLVYIGTGQAGSSETFVAYCFAEIAGFSKFGSYTGNGSADGPFVYCGFRPAYVLVKRTDSTGNWYVWDNKRNTYNVMDITLYPNSSTSDITASDLTIDCLANGFKIRGTSIGINASSSTQIYAAFAENPFKYANAR